MLLAAGCSKETGLVPVGGTVTLEGKPVSGLIVTFAPQGETAGNGAMGFVDDSGRFTLTDSHGEAGAHPGNYRVSFYPALKSTNLAENDPAGVVATPRKSGVPGIYLDPANSPVFATIPQGGANFEVLLTPTGKGAAANALPAQK
jgi:hypothetical protein